MPCVILVFACHFDVFVEAPSQETTLANAHYEVLIAKDRGFCQFSITMIPRTQLAGAEDRVVGRCHKYGDLYLILRQVDDP